MGTNKRYAAFYDKQMERRITELLVRPNPISLTPAELDADNDPIVEAQQPIPVRAWARYPETPARIEGRAVAWTSRAVQVEWEDSGGKTRRAWIWGSAVDKI